MKHYNGQVIRLTLTLALLMMPIAACTSGVAEQPSQQIGVEVPEVAVQTPPTDNGNGVTLTVPPDSLQIKEICTGNDQCVFRQKCGKLRPTLKNDSDSNIQIKKIEFQQLDSNGQIIHRKTLDTSVFEHPVPPHTEAQFYPKLSCKCREDRHCTPSFPHLSNPFLVGRAEVITIFYTTEDNKEGSTSVSANYSLVR